MHCIKNVTKDLIWVGANDRRLFVFEGVYSVPDGVSYNSYLLNDEKTVLFDTVDKAVRQRFMENLAFALKGKKLDYIVVQHMEPDHSAVLSDLIALYPKMKVVCNAKTLEFIKQFNDLDIDSKALIVKENDTLNTGKHTLNFIMAPMVHWPEVMVTYDSTDKTLFSADAFGCFGALNGALFSDEVDFNKDYMDEARRYYTNIAGKYGQQVDALLQKSASVEIEMICPLHGFIWRKNIKDIVSKYALWSNYEPEEYGVAIAYASVYGNTENAAEILACKLREKGIKTTMFDVSVTPSSNIVSAAFKWSHLVFASTTYNAEIFVSMEALINDLLAHNFQNRTVAIIENGSWAATAGGLILKKFENCKNIRVIENSVSLKSSLKNEQIPEIDLMADALCNTFEKSAIAVKEENKNATNGSIDTKTMFKLSYGLFVVTAKDGKKDNGCIVNTVSQLTDKPLRISLTVNKANFTHDMITKTKEFNVSVMSESTPFNVFERFGFQSGKNTDKFTDCNYTGRTANGILYLSQYSNGIISAKVSQIVDCGTHTLFIADVTEAFILSDDKSVTYQYYFDHIKPAPKVSKEQKAGFVCKICAYVYEGDVLPDDFICPLCKHGAADFEKIKN
ncbi:MAG: flavin reductase [Firmicutes bacterium]|nr:flavin reductase [Bacillota bacterium]